MPNKVLLSFGDRSDYDPKALKNFTEQELRAEYSKLRAVAQRRLANFEGTEWVDSETYRRNKNAYPTLNTITSKAQLARKLSDLASFVDASTSTVTGLKHQRRAAINSLHEQGYTFINTKNFKEFTEFMEEMRANNKRFGSPTPEELETLLIGRQKGIKQEDLFADFEFYMENRKTLKKVDIPKGESKSSEDYKKAIEEYKQNKSKRGRKSRR